MPYVSACQRNRVRCFSAGTGCDVAAGQSTYCTTMSDFRTRAQRGADVLGISKRPGLDVEQDALFSCGWIRSHICWRPPSTLSWVAANCVLHCWEARCCTTQQPAAFRSSRLATIGGGANGHRSGSQQVPPPYLLPISGCQQGQERHWVTCPPDRASSHCLAYRPCQRLPPTHYMTSTVHRRMKRPQEHCPPCTHRAGLPAARARAA